jgi:polyhydroxyalkanoate synthase
VQVFPGYQFPPGGMPPFAAVPAPQGFPGFPGTITDADLSRQFSEWSARSAAFVEIQGRYYQKLMRLWSAMLARERGEAYEPVVPADRADKRFAAKEWTEVPYYDYLRQSYLLYAAFLTEAVEAADLEPRAKGRLRFFARQLVDAICPANFAATNPEAIRLALESNGDTLSAGVRNLVGDVAKGRISQSDESGFEVGRNLAATDGTVIFRNELFELIQYAPATESVHARPLLMVPPCINKYYILDLSPANSFVRYAVENGHTVFITSWRNPTAELGHVTWDDYLRDGVIKAIESVRAVTGAEKLNVLGFCVGGTMLSSALAVLAAQGKQWAESLTLLTTLLDFEEAGEIGLLVDETGVAAREATIGAGGILPGSDLATVFSTMRANDLVWSYVVNNYLKGRQPDAFDILYWNADSTNLPGPMYVYYVRNMYLENRLRLPNALTMLGEKIDLGAIGVPTYIYASREDHIVPWKGAYRSTRLMKGDTRFVLGASGHIAGVINPPAAGKRSHWINPVLQPDADAWLALATEHRGSWWPDWKEWIGRFGGGQTKAPKRPGGAKFKPLGPAPGEYVKFRIT